MHDGPTLEKNVWLTELPRLVTNSARETHVFTYFDVDTFVDNMSGNNVFGEKVFWKTTLGHGMKAPQRQEGGDKFTPLFFRSHVYVFDIAIEIIPPTEEACTQQCTHHDDLLTYLTAHRQKPLEALRDFWTDLAAGTVDTEKLDKLAALPTFNDQFLVLATKDHKDAKNTHWAPSPFIKTTTTGGWTNADGIGKNMSLGTLFSSSSCVSSCFCGDTWHPNHKTRPQDHEKETVQELTKVFDVLLGSLRIPGASSPAIDAKVVIAACTTLLQGTSSEEKAKFQHNCADHMKDEPTGTDHLTHLAQYLLPQLDAKLECLKERDEGAYQAKKKRRQETPLSVWLKEHRDGLSARRLIDAEADRLYTLEHGSLPQCDWKKPYADYRKSEDARRAPFFQEILQLHGWADDQPEEGAAALSQ